MKGNLCLNEEGFCCLQSHLNHWKHFGHEWFTFNCLQLTSFNSKNYMTPVNWSRHAEVIFISDRLMVAIVELMGRRITRVKRGTCRTECGTILMTGGTCRARGIIPMNIRARRLFGQGGVGTRKNSLLINRLRWWGELVQMTLQIYCLLNMTSWDGEIARWANKALCILTSHIIIQMSIVPVIFPLVKPSLLCQVDHVIVLKYKHSIHIIS